MGRKLSRNVWKTRQAGHPLFGNKPASPALQCRGLDDPKLGLFCIKKPESQVKWRRAWYSAFGAASSRRAAAQVRQVVHAQTLGDFPQPGSAGGKETAQQPARGQLLQPRLPVLGVSPQPLEDTGQLTGDHGFALAEQPPGVLHQEQVIVQRESFDVSTGRQQRLLIEDRHTLEPRSFACLYFFAWRESIELYLRRRFVKLVSNSPVRNGQQLR